MNEGLPECSGAYKSLCCNYPAGKIHVGFLWIAYAENNGNSSGVGVLFYLRVGGRIPAIVVGRHAPSTVMFLQSLRQTKQALWLNVESAVSVILGIISWHWWIISI
jgi:hypothetical protein